MTNKLRTGRSSLRDRLRQLEHRHVEREQQHRDHQAHDDEHQRLDQRDEAGQRRLDILVVEVRQRVQHILQRAGGLADLHHLHRDVGKDAALIHRDRQRLPFAHLLRHHSDVPRHRAVADGARRDVERGDQRNAAGKQRRQRARELRRRELRHGAADDRRAHQRRVQPHALARHLEPPPERHAAADRARA